MKRRCQLCGTCQPRWRRRRNYAVGRLNPLKLFWLCNECPTDVLVPASIGYRISRALVPVFVPLPYVRRWVS